MNGVAAEHARAVGFRRQRTASDVLNHRFDEVHDRIHIHVCGVELEHGEFRIVLEADALIAEVAADFVDALNAAGDDALQVQLEGDAQVEILVELIVMRDERPGCCAAVDRLQNRGFDFQKILVVEKFAHGRDDARARAEDFAHLGVDSEVGVALAIARLRVAHGAVADDAAVGLLFFFGDGQLADGLGEQAPCGHLQRRFACFGEHELTARLDEVAQVEVLEDVEGFLRERIFADAGEELDAAGAVLDVDEGGFAHAAFADDASHDGAGDGRRFGRLGVGKGDLRGVGGHTAFRGEFGSRGIWIDTGGAQRRQLTHTFAFDFVEFHHAGRDAGSE